MNRTYKINGMTLIELMITIVIISILLSIAVPLYKNQIIKARRNASLATLVDLSIRMERYYTEHQTFVGANSTILTTPNNQEDYYSFSFHKVTATTFTITATPLGTQANDYICGALSINQLGERSISGTGKIAECWH